MCSLTPPFKFRLLPRTRRTPFVDVGGFCYTKNMKLYVFSDDDINEKELDDLAMMLHIHKKRMRERPNKIQDEDVLKLATQLNLSINQIEKIMKRKKK